MERALIAAGSVPVLERPEEVAPLVTELIAGERLVVLERRGGWLRVVAPGHATGLDPRGYPGWARAGGLVDAPGWEPNLAVVAPNGAGLPLGARLRREGKGPASPTAAWRRWSRGPRSPRATPWKRRRSGSPANCSACRTGWGGTDSTVGMDCSGLVFRVMGLLGVVAPRDADDRFERAPFGSRES